MSGFAVRAENLGKSFWISKSNGRRPRSFFGNTPTEVRALEGVTFDVAEGEALGIIGRNGAGKSTLLKILSRITAPSRGRVLLTGHVASLLEVGTGFHPDLTGRENVYLNGMLLGMRSRDVSAAFDAISDFAGVGQYIDVPIKRYSSGMQLRLAFAVAAHLAADIMIIDEVLAVGDAEFQRKCLGAMRDVSGQGRTTLFVSHNLSAVESLCTRVLWLDAGRVKSVGAPDQVIRDYLAAALHGARGGARRVYLEDRPRGWTLGTGRIHSVTFTRLPGQLERAPWLVSFGERFRLDIGFVLERSIPDLVVGISIRNDRGEDVLVSHSVDAGPCMLPAGSVKAEGRVTVEAPWLRPGTYYVEAALLSGAQVVDLVSEAAALTVEEQVAPMAPSIRKGAATPIWHWDIV